MSTATVTATPRPLRPPAPVRRAARPPGALFRSASAVLEAVDHGWAAGLPALVLFVAPDPALLMGLSGAPRTEEGRLPARAAPYRNAVHRAPVPLVLLVLPAVGPPTRAPVPAALCGGLAHISYDRAFGYGPRTKEGSQRG